MSKGNEYCSGFILQISPAWAMHNQAPGYLLIPLFVPHSQDPHVFDLCLPGVKGLDCITQVPLLFGFWVELAKRRTRLELSHNPSHGQLLCRHHCMAQLSQRNCIMAQTFTCCSKSFLCQPAKSRNDFKCSAVNPLPVFGWSFLNPAPSPVNCPFNILCLSKLFECVF